MTKEEKLERLNQLSEFNIHNGIVITDVGEGKSTVEMTMGENTLNPWGTVHGGLIFSLCDVAAGVATTNGVGGCLTQSGNIYYLRPAVGKKIRAEAVVVKNGKTVSVVETNVYTDTNELVAKAVFEYYKTNSVLPRK